MANLYFEGDSGTIIVDGEKIEIKRAKAFKDFPDKTVHISELQGIEFKGNPGFGSTTKGYIKLIIPTTQVTSRGLFQTWNDLMDENKIYYHPKKESLAIAFKNDLEKYLFEYKSGKLNTSQSSFSSSSSSSSGPVTYGGMETTRRSEPKSIEELNEQQRNDLIEYIDIQLAKDDREDITKLQNSYFGTSSLAYMKYLAPDVTSFTSLGIYKEQLNTLKASLSPSTVEESPTETPEQVESVKPTNSTADDMDEITNKLIKFKELMEKGLIDEDEYKKKKAQLLGI